MLSSSDWESAGKPINRPSHEWDGLYAPPLSERAYVTPRVEKWLLQMEEEAVENPTVIWSSVAHTLAESDCSDNVSLESPGSGFAT
jgi:hypothetical protein